MAGTPPELPHKVWLYRDPQRTAFLTGLLALLCWSVIRLLRHEPDTYAHQHAGLTVLSGALVVGFLAAAYVPQRWKVLANGLALALSFGALAFVLLA